MKFLITGIGILAGAFLLVAGAVNAQQPPEDGIDIDISGCVVTVEWIDGMEDVTSFTVSNEGISTEHLLDDIVGDESGVVLVFTAQPGNDIIARLFDGDEEVDVAFGEVGKCPTPTATATATPTNTATPTATNTPVPATATPVVVTVPVQVPVVVERIVERPAPTPIVITRTVIQPPSTGDGGLVD